MTSANKLKYIKKVINMEIITNQIQVTLTKTQINSIISEALADPTTNAAIKRILNPLIAGSFTQFPNHSIVALGDTLEDGSTICTLKQPRAVTAKSEPSNEETETPEKSLESIEPLVESEDN